MDPISMYERAATRAAAVAASVPPDRRDRPTPCADWDVGQLLAHMAGGSDYLLGALGLEPATDTAAAWPAPEVVERCTTALRAPGALERTCTSPANFEWSVAEAAAGTAMDQLIHTWDLAVALDLDRTLDPEVTEAIVAMFLPAMPEVGRQAGLVGPPVPVADDAPPQDRLLGAMGRDPRR